MIKSSEELTQNEKEMITKDHNENNIIHEDDNWYYNDTTYVTNSHLKVLKDEGPEGLRDYYRYGSGDTAAFSFGRAFHTLILEPEDFNSRYFILDDTEKCEEIGGKRPRTTKKYAEWLETIEQENEGKEILSMETMNTLEKMEEKLLSIPQVVSLLNDSKKEIIYKGEIEGVPVKGKIDAIKPNKMIIDLKTTSATPTLKEFSKSFRNYNYDRQMAFYAEIAQVPNACIIAIKKTAPYTVGVYMISEESLDSGRAKFMNAIQEFKSFYLNGDINKFYYQGEL